MRQFFISILLLAFINLNSLCFSLRDVIRPPHERLVNEAAKKLNQKQQTDAQKKIKRATEPTPPPKSASLPTKAEVMEGLGNHRNFVRVTIIDKDGNLSYFVPGLSLKKKTIHFQQDFSNFREVVANGVTNKLGFLIRTEARFVCSDNKIDLSGLFGIGVAARQGKVAGELEVIVRGLSGEPISNAIFSSGDISDGSAILRAIEAMAALKASIYDPRVKVSPEIIPDSILSNRLPNQLYASVQVVK